MGYKSGSNVLSTVEVYTSGFKALNSKEVQIPNL